MKRHFLPVASSSVSRRPGQTIFSASPGSPAPAPMSTALGDVASQAASGRPSMRGRASRQESESMKCLVSISAGSVMEVRFMRWFQSSNSSWKRRNKAIWSSVSSMPIARAWSCKVMGG